MFGDCVRRMTNKDANRTYKITFCRTL